MNDLMAQLAEANPVRVEDLTPLGVPNVARRPMPSGRLVAVAIVAAVAASLLGGLLAGGTGSHRTARPHPTSGAGTGSNGLPPATVAHPLASGTKVTLAEAAAAIGQRVVLPDTTLIRPEDVGPVWALPLGARGYVAVTYPAARLFVVYQRPAPPMDSLRWFTDLAKQSEGSHVIRAGRIPALFLRGNDGTGNNVVMFEINGLLIAVTGPYGDATLRAVARSIVARSPSTVSRPGLNLLPVTPPRKPISLRKVSRRLGVTVPLPSLRLLRRATAGEGWEEGTCPPRGRQGCMIWIPFPAESVSIVYQRPCPWPRTRRQYEIEAKHDRVSRVVELDGVPAWEVPPNVDHRNAGLIYFAVAGTRVIVSGHRRRASLEAIARSIVHRSQS